LTNKTDDPKADVKSPADVYAYWKKELDAADRHERSWRELSDKIVKRYRAHDEKERADLRGALDSDHSFNILYANTEVLKGVMYQQRPTPDVRRRYLDKDPVGREAAKVLERALSYSMDADVYDFDAMIDGITEDVLLPGRGVARVRYAPTIHTAQRPVTGPDGQPVMDAKGQPVVETVEEVVDEAVPCEYVPWKFFRYSVAERWEDVRWVAFGKPLTREDLRAQVPDVADAVTLDWSAPGSAADDETAKRALVWMVWEKKTRQVHLITTGYTEGPLKTEPDPLRLEGFFPTPRPLYGICTTNSLIPVPEYTQYQSQAEELDDVTERITVLIDALRRRGIYDATFTELADLARCGDNHFVPVKDFTQYVEKGGLEKVFMELPIDGLAKVLLQLYDQRDRIKQVIYEITGLSDIVRGATKASETLGAQEMKSRYANVRIGPRQAGLQRYIRDLLRLKAEIMAEHFQPQTLANMTGIQLPTAEQKQMAMQAQQMGMVGPQPGIDMNLPTWDEVMQVLKSDKLRGFRVDIETDSTIRPHAEEEQRQRSEMLTAIGAFLQQAIPAVQAGAMPKKVAMELLLFGVRAFKVGPQLEDVLTQWADGQLDQAMPQQGGVDPAIAEAEKAVAGEKVKQEQHKTQGAQANAQKAHVGVQNEIRKGQQQMMPHLGVQ
jgi:hypothetical protein